MVPQIIYITIVLFILFNTLNAQTGHGCQITTCPDNPGQVRMNAIFDKRGSFIGGCNCGCQPLLYDPSSVHYCPPPNIVNFDPTTRTGNCACHTPVVPPPQVNQHLPGPNEPNYGEPGPTAQIVCPPSINEITGIAQSCDGPVGHIGDVIITCSDAEACIEQVINCNNDGFSCTVKCISESACDGLTIINGPKDGSLTVNCMGEFSCEGGTVFNGDKGKDLYINCDGVESCIMAYFNMGFGQTVIFCNGGPESCEMASFNLYPNALNTVGVSFACMGQFCPVDAPKSFSNYYGPVTKFCNGPGNGNCACPPENSGCIINCVGAVDACKDSIISCNSNGHACTVNCNEDQSCAGSTIINGPIGGSLTVTGNGLKALEGTPIINGKQSTDVSIICNGPEACKGNPTYNFGTGESVVECNGKPDSCSGAPIFNFLPNAENTPGMSFVCVGLCPANRPPLFNNVVGPPPIIVGPVPTYIPPAQPAHPNAPRTDHCCVITDPQMTQFQGRCWYYTWESGCLGENGICQWNINKCLTEIPTCGLAFHNCMDSSDCCSGFCVNKQAGGVGECY